MSELQETFNTFFGVTEETAGTGTAQREINGQIRSVIVDQAEHDAWLAQREAEAQAAREERRRLDELMLRLNW